MKLYKVLTHDYCSPLQGGEPIFDGKTPFTLPPVQLDTCAAECAAGWNACRKPEDAVQIAGLWRDGRPARLFEVEPDKTLIHRGDKSRFASGVIVSEIDIRVAIEPLSEAFGKHKDFMVREQLAWHRALGRPLRVRRRVVAGLERALATRGLEWELREFEDARAARAAWAAWANKAVWIAKAARAATVWDAWDFRAAWNARADRAARAARAAAAWDAWDTWDAWDARDALTLAYASRQEWIDYPANHLTVGLRSAYYNGLGIALPTGLNELGWVMDEVGP